LVRGKFHGVKEFLDFIIEPGKLKKGMLEPD
jgi:hypothetical protein